VSNDQPPLETRMVFPVFLGSTNHYDTVIGGQAMAWMDQAAFICATLRVWKRRYDFPHLHRTLMGIVFIAKETSAVCSVPKLVFQKG
jgi:hypothetical protein